MKGKTKMGNQSSVVRRGRRHLSISLALALTLSPVAVFAEGEAITNNTLPVPQPAPSRLVQKIWGSLQMPAVKNTSTGATSGKKTKKEPVKKAEAATGDATSQTAESTTAATGVTSTGQIVFDTPASSEKSAGESTGNSKPETQTANNKIAATTNGVGSTKKPASEISTTSGDTAATIETTGSQPATSAPGAAPKAAPEVTAQTTEKPSHPITIASNLVSLPPGSVLSRVQNPNSDALVIDNDEVQEVEETIKQEELPTDDGKTHAKAGAKFPVVISSQINSKSAKQGDPIQARLKYDLKIGDRLVAKKGAVVNGHVNYVLHARTILHSLVSPERWYRNSGCLGLSFDEIINEKGEHLPLNAQPARQARIVKNKAEGRELGVNHYGQVTGPWAQQIRYKAIRIGLNAALAPAGVFSFGAMPVALGVLGAANPSFAFAKPVGLNVRHRRIKGFAWGFLSGVPGSWLIEDTTIKGQEAIVKPGDEFYAELVQEFTGEPASDAQLMPGATTKLHGQVLTDPKKVKKNKSNGAPKQENR